MFGKMRLPTTRTKDGRKIDTWNYQTAERDSLSIDIFMHVSETHGISFQATSKAPLLHKYEWTNTDLESLRIEVSEDLSTITRNAASHHWAPAIAAQVKDLSSDSSALDQKPVVAFSIIFEPMLAKRDEPKNNFGSRTVIKDGFVQTVVERSPHDEKIPTRISDIRIEADQSLLLLSDTPSTRSEIEQVNATLKSFIGKLMHRLSPNATEGTAMPSPDDLTEMMKDAASQVKSNVHKV